MKKRRARSFDADLGQNQILGRSRGMRNSARSDGNFGQTPKVFQKADSSVSSVSTVKNVRTVVDSIIYEKTEVALSMKSKPVLREKAPSYRTLVLCVKGLIGLNLLFLNVMVSLYFMPRFLQEFRSYTSTITMNSLLLFNEVPNKPKF